jgi:hypothetical protein
LPQRWLSSLPIRSVRLLVDCKDTIKVRQQLQNEGNNVKVYRNSYDAFTKIYRSEGIKGLQKGIIPAILREGSKNMFRIGMYDPIMSVLHDPAKGSAPGWKRILAGSMCGLMGAFSCNPFELVKTRLQSASTTVIVGKHQFEYILYLTVDIQVFGMPSSLL